MSAIADLRRLIENRFPNAVPLPERTVPQVPTGIEALDRILPAGGLPRGRLTTWVPGTGGAAVMRSACDEAVSRGERAAWVDSTGLVIPGRDWGDVLLARTRDDREALECTEELLRSGGFALVVRVGEESGGAERVRLCRAAREGGAAFVEFTEDSHMAAVRLQSWTEVGSFRWRFDHFGEPILIESVSLRVRARAGGWVRESEVVLEVSNHEHTLSIEPGLADRRGVRRGDRAASAE